MAWCTTHQWMSPEGRSCVYCTIATLTAERDALAARLTTTFHDWYEDDTAIRDALRPILGALVDGDANGVPPLVDLVEQVVGRVREVELAVHACESAQ